MGAGTTSTRVTTTGVVESTLAGRAVGQTIADLTASFVKANRGRPVWLIRAEETTSYAPDAVTQAVTSFGDLHTKHGLRKIIAVIKMPTVRMGASIVSMSLRAAGSSLEIVVVESVEEAHALLST